MKNDFARTLARILAERDMTQYRLALRSGVGTVTLNRLVNGVRPPTEWQVLRIGIGLTGDFEQAREINRLLDEAGLKVFGAHKKFWRDGEKDEEDEDRDGSAGVEDGVDVDDWGRAIDAEGGPR